MKLQKTINTILVGTIALVLAGCGGGGGSSSGNGPAAPTISTPRALPNQLITITDETITAGEVVDVAYRPVLASGSQSTPINVKAVATTTGKVTVTVPPFVDLDNGEFAAGEMSVAVNGRRIGALLTVDNFMELGFNTEGQITVGLLEYAIESYEVVLLNLDDLEVEMPEVGEINGLRRKIEGEIERLEFMADEIDIWGTLTVDVDGVTTVLSTEQLDQLDIWNLHLLVSAQVQMDMPSARTALLRSVRAPGTRRIIQDAWEEAKQALRSSSAPSESTKQTINDFFGRSMRNAIREGKRALNGGLALLGLFFSGAATASSGAASTVANADGLAVATLSAWASATQAQRPLLWLPK